MCKTGQHCVNSLHVQDWSALRTGGVVCIFIYKLQWNTVTEHVSRPPFALMHKPVLQSNSTWKTSFIEKGDFKNMRLKKALMTLANITAKPVSLFVRASLLWSKSIGRRNKWEVTFLVFWHLKLVLQPSQRHPHRGTHLETSTMSFLSRQNFLLLLSVLFVQVAADPQGE